MNKAFMLDAGCSPKMMGLMVICSVFLLAGCTSIGPPTIDQDRFDYGTAISESWKRQTLLNLIKIRYMDAPVFMDVSSVISQYALESEIEAGLTWSSANSQTLGGSATYTDRPTISYSPLTGEAFARGLLRPIPLSITLLLIQSGYPIDYVMRICVQGINGLDNRSVGLTAHSHNAEFFELLQLLKKIQQEDGMRMRIRFNENGETLVLQFREPQTDRAAKRLKRIFSILGLDEDAREFNVVHGYIAENDREIAIINRSMMQIMTDYASYIEVPEADVVEGRVYGAGADADETESQFPPLIRVRSAKSAPDDAFIDVSYREHSFYIDDRDLHSKRTFYFLMLMFSFTERSEHSQAKPVLTVPTN